MLRRHYVPRSEGELVYSSPPTIKTYVPMLLNLLVYIITFALWMYLDSAYYGFGSKIITPLTGAMWVVGAVFALILPSQREEIIRHTKWFILGYVGILFLYRYVIIAVSGVSADNLTAAFNQAIASSSATAVVGWLQNLLWIIAITYPIAFYLSGKENSAILRHTLQAACDKRDTGCTGQYQTILNGKERCYA